MISAYDRYLLYRTYAAQRGEVVNVGVGIIGDVTKACSYGGKVRLSRRRLELYAQVLGGAKLAGAAPIFRLNFEPWRRWCAGRTRLRQRACVCAMRVYYASVLCEGACCAMRGCVGGCYAREGAWVLGCCARWRPPVTLHLSASNRGEATKGGESHRIES